MKEVIWALETLELVLIMVTQDAKQTPLEVIIKFFKIIFKRLLDNNRSFQDKALVWWLELPLIKEAIWELDYQALKWIKVDQKMLSLL
jgi:hypothetical protein